MRSRRSIAALAKAKNISSMGGHPAENAREALAQAFLKRSVKMLERVSSSASSEALKSALSSPTDVGGVATLLSDLVRWMSISPQWIRSWKQWRWEQP